MMFRLAALSLTAAACTDPVVEMELHMPANAATFDTSCISAVSVMVAGANIAQDFNDYTWSCQEITAQPRLAGVHDEIRGKFDLQIPDSGMAGIEIFGWSGPQPCAPPEFVSPDLIFHSTAPYIGQDTLELELETTMDCAKQPVKLRPVELFALVGGATPSSTNCTVAAVTDAAEGYATLGQLMENDFMGGIDYWGGFYGANITNGIATFSASTTGMTKSCLAYDLGSAAGFATGCTMTGAHVCAAADEIDAPFVSQDIERESLTLDEALLAKWDGRVFVSVWDNGNPKRPVAGAKVEILPADGQVIYVDPPAAGSTKVTKRSDSMTGPSGLAAVYTNKLANVRVTVGGATREVTITAPDWSVGAALVVMASAGTP